MKRMVRAIAVAGTSLGLVAAALSTPAVAESRWSGYPIPATGTAAGGWIGGYQEGRATVYRIDPTAKPRRSAHRTGTRVGDLNGSRKPGQVATQRAAWILSKYGDYRLAVQAAAVDAALLHLLKRKKWRIGKSRGSRRIRRSAAPKDVRRFARTMLERSARQRGPYVIRMQATDTPVEGRSRGRVTVLSATGKPVSDRPVTFSLPGAKPVTTHTDATGRAEAMLRVTQPGRHTMRAQVAELPDSALTVRKPRRRKSSRVVVAGRKVSRVVTATFSASGAQQISITSRAAKIGISTPLTGAWSVAGSGGTRTVTYGLHGPFSSSSTVCTTKPVVTTSTQITQDGTFPLPSWRVQRPGYWVWSVKVGPNATNQASSACGGLTVVKTEPTAGITHLSGSPVTKGSNVRAEITVRGLPNSAPVTVRGRLFGPFGNKANVRCSDGKLYKQSAISFTGDGTKKTSFLKVRSSGFYVWQARIAEGPLSLPGLSACGQRFRVD